ncbi:MAG: TlpA family protein disulfide reductase [Pedobacter sp.]|nr:MAG: TlpA family protein disulfide reductase [Pedobacter sp.]
MIRSIIVLSFVLALLQSKNAVSQTISPETPGKHIVKNLKIGDRVPNVLLPKILNYHSKDAQIADFKGKLLILDFWATWCGACISMIPRMDSLQKEFGGKIQIMSVTSEPETVVKTFIEKYEKRNRISSIIPNVVGDTILRKLFHHYILPHYVWIDETGIVRGITDMEDLTAANIASLLKDEKTQLSLKTDPIKIPYNKDKPILINGNGGSGNNLIYHSILTRYTEGLSGGFSFRLDTLLGNKITVTNCSRLWLYKLAYSKLGSWFGDNNVILKVKNPSQLTSNMSGSDYRNWLNDNNGFCYELIVPASLIRRTSIIMQNDLKNFFPEYSATVMEKTVPCLSLIRTDSTKVLSSTGGNPVVSFDPFSWKLRNARIGVLVDRINKMQRHNITLVNETGIKIPFDMDISGSLEDIDDINRDLSKYGMKVIKSSKVQQILVIEDALPNSTRLTP